MYQRATQASNAFGIIGNANLDFSKTISYSFGTTYKLSNDYSLDVNGYYKDIFGIINSVREGTGPNQQNVYQNSDYARVRGFEMELDKKGGSYVQGTATYNYSFAYGKSSDASSNYFDDFYSRAIPIQEFPLSWDVRHQVTVNVDLSIPLKDHPKLFGLKMPDNCGMNFVWQYGSGFPFTPDKDYPGLRLLPGETPQTNSLRYPPTSTVDVRAYKRFPFLGLNYTVELWVNNLFNRRNVNFIYGLTGRYDTNSKPTGSNFVYQGAPIDNSPLDLEEGRNIRVGVGVEF
jgi:outer membrane receptor protein involved in Fe transport